MRPHGRGGAVDAPRVFRKDPERSRNPENFVVGVQGVRLKRFERVVASLLREKVEPVFVKLPPFPHNKHPSWNLHDDGGREVHHDEILGDEWPFDRLPQAARVHGTLPGQLPEPERARRKEDQLRSMLRCILNLTARNSTQGLEDLAQLNAEHPYTIIDFGGGSGHLAIPLALLLPTFRIVVVDLCERSLQLLHTKAKACRIEQLQTLKGSDQPEEEKTPTNLNANKGNEITDVPQVASTASINRGQKYGLRCETTCIPNLFTFHGPVHAFTCQRLDMAVALHLCGEATDTVLRVAGSHPSNPCIVAAPCCVGKLAGGNRNPYIWQAHGSNTPTVIYPQSKQICHLLGSASGPFTSSDQAELSVMESWNALAKAADFSAMEQTRTSQNAIRRTAKAMLEWDRCLFLQQSYDYRTALTRMHPWEASPKHDILVAWKAISEQEAEQDRMIFSTRDPACEMDIQLAKSHLLELPIRLEPDSLPATTVNLSVAPKDSGTDKVDWTVEEEEAVRRELLDFFGPLATDISTDRPVDDRVLTFPTRLGGRKRKLIHFVAQQLKLAHWCEGRRSAEKTVVVALRGRREGRGGRPVRPPEEESLPALA